MDTAFERDDLRAEHRLGQADRIHLTISAPGPLTAPSVVTNSTGTLASDR